MQPKSAGTLLIKTGILLFIYVMYSGCTKSTHKDDEFTPPFDINVTLGPFADTKGIGSKASGFVKFRQNADTGRIIDLDTWVTNLTPNHSYFLQRAVNPITDPD